MKKLILASILSSSSFALVPIAQVPIVDDFILFENIDEVTPPLISKQAYLENSPVGIGAISAWKIPGGKGENVKIIDVETGLDSEHEDLPKLFFSQIPTVSQHGSAVMGIMGGSNNEFGITGIAHGANLGFAGFIEGDEDISDRYIKGIVNSIKSAREQLQAGDVLVIEQQVTGPVGDYILVEYWDEIFQELKLATDKGIHCIEAAGNGNSNLDHPGYNDLLNRKVRDSGCIVVGAGNADKLKLGFSNYGSIVDSFGYGTSVTATGYGDAFNGGVHRIYTHRFNGTSSATPIVAGAVALVSSIAEQQGIKISPLEMRKILKETGVKQEGDISQSIGTFPHIEKMLKALKVKSKKSVWRKNRWWLF